ncbi:MAG: hypothetical protein IJX21_02975 [Alistipes sp.]|nr:hypothetical protein [Alistipes sp.]
MKKIFYLFAATVVLAAVGCSKDDAAQEEVKYVSEIKIGFEGDTRVTAEQIASGLKFSFEDGEEICLNEYNPDRIGIIIYYVYDASSKTFKAKYESYKLQEGKKYFAMAGSYMSISVDVVDGNIEAYPKLGEEAEISDIPMISDVFTASADGTVATMHHLVGVVEVPATLDESSTVETLYRSGLTGVVGLAGEFIAIPEAPYFQKISFGYAKTMSDVLNVKLSKTTATSIFIPVLPGTYSTADLTLDRLYYPVGSSTTTASGRKLNPYDGAKATLVVERGKITKITECALTLN